jgi:hypothetical protein
VALHTDPSYMGLRQPRDRSSAYDELIEVCRDNSSCRGTVLASISYVGIIVVVGVLYLLVYLM